MHEDPKSRVHAPLKGRGAVSNLDSRYNAHTREPVDDGWTADEAAEKLNTTVTEESARTIISRNRSPDLPFEQSVNAYRGCEHGCIYCYARPSHAYLGLSPGLDFESRLFVKPNAPELLVNELSGARYVCKPIAMGTNTDPYQPIEREHRITRRILEVLLACRHPVTVTTKSALIERDLDLLTALAERNLVQVQISLTTLDRQLSRLLEPRAAAPERRLVTIRRLSHAGIPVAAMIAPVIPFLTDAELECLLEQAAAAGASHAHYILLRLPLELKELFGDWLEVHYPLKRRHILNRLAEQHGGQLYDSSFATRQSGTGPFAELMRQRFRLAMRRQGLDRPLPLLDTSQFQPPRPKEPQQLSLF
ncbi:MAG: radical domain protein [Proteobacteria bacterium]|nr:radical domain protein [Pseudomonadota bacterium]